MNARDYTYLPIFLDLRGLKVLVIGGGTVGTKRALKFAELMGDVTVVSLDFSTDLQRAYEEKKIKLIKGDAKSLINDNFLSQYHIIVTATSDRTLNSSICKVAKILGKLCNDPTNPEESNFIVPIYSIEDSIGVAVTTFGKSSLSSKFILQMIKERVLNDEVKKLVEVMGLVKDKMKSEVEDPRRRFSLYSLIFNDPKFRDYVSKNDIEHSIKRAEEIINGNKTD